MLLLETIEKSYGNLRALKGVSLEVPEGCFFGLLGPNGAGKTTLMSIIVGLLEPDQGQMSLGGQALNNKTTELRAKIGFVPQRVALYDDVSATENLSIFGELNGLRGQALKERTAEVIQQVGLSERAGDRVGTFSGGMKRRLNIAASLLHRPSLLLCDEPTVGVDPQSRNAIFEMLEQLSSEGMTIIYTSHYMEEVERLCERIAIIDDGEILAEGTQKALICQSSGGSLLKIEAAKGDEGLRAKLAEFGAVQEQRGKILLELRSDKPLSEAILLLEEYGLDPSSFELEQPSLENLFLHLTGKTLRD